MRKNHQHFNVLDIFGKMIPKIYLEIPNGKILTSVFVAGGMKPILPENMNFNQHLKLNASVWVYTETMRKNTIKSN